MTWDEIRALAAAGMAIESHTRDHRVLESMPPAELADDLAGARAELARELGGPRYAIAYPVGRSIAGYPEVRAAVAAAGYRLGFTNASGRLRVVGRPGLDRLDLARVAVDRDLPDAVFLAQLHLRPLRLRPPSPEPMTPIDKLRTAYQLLRAGEVRAALDEFDLPNRAAAARARAETAVRRAWMKYALRTVRQNDAHDRLDLAYKMPDPWHMASPQEQARFAETNAGHRARARRSLRDAARGRLRRGPPDRAPAGAGRSRHRHRRVGDRGGPRAQTRLGRPSAARATSPPVTSTRCRGSTRSGASSW
jgi:peptidoglycan/xylan/chitin deacetylase (PgdA/CDA1 family)